MASDSSAPFRCILHVVGTPRCGLCCIKKKSQLKKLISSASLILENICIVAQEYSKEINQNKAEPGLVQEEII